MKRAAPSASSSSGPLASQESKKERFLKQLEAYQTELVKATSQEDAQKEISALMADVKVLVDNYGLAVASNDKANARAGYYRRKAAHDQKVADLERELAEAKAKLTSPYTLIAESAANAFRAASADLDALRWDDAAERATLYLSDALRAETESVSKLDVLQTVRFKSPTILVDARATLDLIETPEYHKIKGILQRMAHEAYPTSAAIAFEIGLVWGAMGVGKRFTTWKAATSISGVIPCYLRLDVFLGRLPKATEPSLNSGVVLAAALAYVFSDHKIRSLNLNLHEVISKIQHDLALGRGGSKLILHVDGYQVEPSVTQKLVSGCLFTLIEDFGIAVIPVVSGISGRLDLKVCKNATTTWALRSVQIRALPRIESELAAAGALKIPVDSLRASKNMQMMFNDCGDQAHLIVTVIRAIRAEEAIWQRLISDGEFENESAMIVYQKALASIGSVYGIARWQRLVRASYKGDDQNTFRESWDRVTVKLIRKILWLALSKTPFSEKDSLLDDDRKVSLDQCQDAGMLSLEASVPTGSVVVTMPLMALVVMNQIGQLLPSSIQFENPFGTDWETLERVAMACLMAQLRADAPAVPLHALRPGASLFTEREVAVNIPQRLDFCYLGTYIEAEQLLRGKMAEGGVAELNIGDVMISATSQFAHDGIAILEGQVEGSSRPILWFSQLKAVDGIDERTGERSASTQQNGSVQSTILPKMQKGAAQFKAKFPQFNDAFVVYDVFSDREPPSRGNANGGVNLESNEALFVTRSDTLPMVLGGLAARKREIVDM